MIAVTAEQFEELMERELPFAKTMGLAVDQVGESSVQMRAVYNEAFLRPGGTVSGPVMMGLADAAMYLAVMARIGPVALAVTTQLSINFLRKPKPGDVIAVAKLLKLGKRLAVGEVSLYSASHPDDEMVAHVTATYSIPPAKQIT